MANIRSQKKRIRQNEKARLRNKAVKSSLKTAIRKFREAAEAGNVEEAIILQRAAARQLDKAVSKGVIHKNQAANRKSAIAKRLRAGLAIIDKRRDGPNVAVFMHLIGDVKGKDAVIIDDMIDTAGTLVQAADALKREGARRILACGVHPVLSGPALARIEGAPLEEVVVTNSIPLGKDKQIPKITVLSVAPLLAEAIRRIHDEESVSTLFV